MAVILFLARKMCTCTLSLSLTQVRTRTRWSEQMCHLGGEINLLHSTFFFVVFI
jgi:hypothetical protein